LCTAQKSFFGCNSTNVAGKGTKLQKKKVAKLEQFRSTNIQVESYSRERICFIQKKGASI
jgi:hypothetical protein